MLQTLWKLTFLTGVVGIGLLVVWQAKNGMRYINGGEEGRTVAEEKVPDPASAPKAELGKSSKGTTSSPRSGTKSGSSGVIPAASKTGKADVPVAANSQKKKSDDSSNDLFTEDLPPAKPYTRKASAAVADPFKDDLFKGDNVEIADAATPRKPSRSPASRSPITPVAGEADDADPFADNKPPATGSSSKLPEVEEPFEGVKPDLRGKSTLKPEASVTKSAPHKPAQPPAKQAIVADSQDVPAIGADHSKKEGRSPGRSTQPVIKPQTDPGAGTETVSPGVPKKAEASPELDLTEPSQPGLPPAAPPKPAAKPVASKPPEAYGTNGTKEKETDDFLDLIGEKEKPDKKPPAATPRTVTPQASEELPISVLPSARPPVTPVVPVAPRSAATELPTSTLPTPTLNPTPSPTPNSLSDGVPTPVPPREPSLPVTPVIPVTPVTPVLPRSSTASLEPFAEPPRRTVPRKVPRGVQKPQVTIDKVAPATAVLGRPMIYHIHVRNVGTIPAHQVVVEDRIPTGVQLEGTIPQAQLAGDRLIWRLGTIEKNSEKKISVKVVPESEGEVGSVATVNFSAEVGAQTNVTAPQLEFHITGPDQATLGSQVTYSFQVTNVGRGQAYNVKIRNVIPAALRHAAGDDLEMEDAIQLAAGKSYETSLTLAAAQLGKTVNRAVVTADGGISVQAEAPLEIVTPGLSVTRDGPKRLMLNRRGTFTNTVSNASTQMLRNVTITETVPGGFDFVSATENGRYDATRKVVSWTLDRLNPKQSQSLQVTLASVGRGSLVSVVRATDGAGANGETMGTTHIAGVAAVSVDVANMPSYMEVGQQAAIKVRIRNRGTDVAENVRVRLVLPTGTELVLLNGGKYHREGDELVFDPIPRIQPRHELGLDLTIKAIEPQETRLQVLIQNDGQSQPLRRDEAFSIINAQ